MPLISHYNMEIAQYREVRQAGLGSSQLVRYPHGLTRSPENDGGFDCTAQWFQLVRLAHLDQNGEGKRLKWHLLFIQPYSWPVESVSCVVHSSHGTPLLQKALTPLL